LSFRSLYGDGWSVPRLDEGKFWLVAAANALGERAARGAPPRTIENCDGPYLLMEPRLDRPEAEGFLESDQANGPRRRGCRVTVGVRGNYYFGLASSA